MFESYDLSKKYIVACSGGPDSMALLNMLKNHNFNIAVAMVNYKTRLESDEEEQLVRNYCKENNIKLASKLSNFVTHGNTQRNNNFEYNKDARMYVRQDTWLLKSKNKK